MGTLTLLAVAAALVLVAMLVLWRLSLVLHDSSIVDIAWGPLFVLIALTGAAFGDGWLGRRSLVAVLVAVWGLRLALHIGGRNRGKGEDPRYARWREEHGDAWERRSLTQVFLLQGAILWFVALPIMLAETAPWPAYFTAWDAVGALVWGLGFVIETIADTDLQAFKDAHGHGVLRDGLWRFSRHPNYFGEAVLWWGIGLVALAVPWGWLTLLSPLVMTLLLRYVSGVPLAEQRMAGRPGWDDYVRATNPFIPGPPRR